MKKWFFLIFLFSFAACEEHNSKGYISKEENGGDEVYKVDSDDKEMNAAIERAKATYNDFLKVLQILDSSLSDFSVKMRFEYGDNDGEHMWLGELHFRDEKLFGVLDSDPVSVTSVKAGDSLEIKKELLSDWMYVKGNKLVGGYTIKAVYNKLSEQEKRDFRKDIPFEIE